jgi:uncharacterized protein involved in exopolysaccharide biosynthesis
MNTAQNLPQPQSDEPHSSAIEPMEVLHFVVAAARRHLFTCFIVGLLTLVVALAIVSALPRTFESTSKIHATSAVSITTELTRGHVPNGGGGVIKDVSEVVFNHSNLQTLVEQAKLYENWPKTRNWAQRLMDVAREKLVGVTSRKDMEKGFISTLEQSIEVTPEDSSSVRFRARWRDPATAQVLAGLIQDHYIAAKEEEEVAAITRAITVIEQELKFADDGFGPAVAELRAQIKKIEAEAKTAKVTDAPRTAAPSALVTIAAAPSAPPPELSAKLEALRQEERAVLEPWQRRAAELKFQLADLRAVYGPQHPSVVQLEAKLSAATAEPVELLDIRQQQEQVKASLANWGVTGSTRTIRTASGKPANDPDALRDLIGTAADDPRLAPARLQLETVLRKAQDMSSRLDAARMELALTRAAFKYRYRQVEPARYWSKPIKPKVPIVTAIAVVLALIVGFLAGAGRDLLSGKLIENWQARQIGLDVITTVDVSSWQDSRASRTSSLPPPRTLRSK